MSILQVEKWVFRYLASSPVVPVAYVISIGSSLVLQYSNIEATSLIISLMVILLSLYFSSRVSSIFEYAQIPYLLNLPVSASSILFMFLSSSLILAAPLSFVVFDNSGIDLSFTLFILALLYLLLYSDIAFLLSVNFRRNQISSMSLVLLSFAPIVPASILAGPHISSYSFFFALSPISGTVLSENGFFRYIIGWLVLYNAITAITIIGSFYWIKWRDLL